MPFKKMEDEVLACVFDKINHRKTRRIFHEENLENLTREKEIKKKKYIYIYIYIPKDRRLERIQISQRF